MVTQTGEPSIRVFGWLRRLHPVLNGVGIALLCSQPGWSHGAIATVTPTFSIEASYASGEPMALAQVVVYSPDAPTEPWATGKTDQQGTFEFAPDTDGNWEVVIRQAGHGTTVHVPVGTTAQPPSAQASASTTLASNGPFRRWASAGAGLWGLVGTALFFSRGKQSS
ncbi:MAG: carboxypeptidase-like regulatory domain-containing protein [Cyanobacteria bacterium J06642_11]